MATAESLPPTSRRFAQAAATELNRLTRQLRRLDQRIANLRHEVSAAELQRSELQTQIELLLRVSNEPVRLSVVSADVQKGDAPRAMLRGAKIREAAVRAYRAAAISGPIHYQRWYELLQKEGQSVAGRDPKATFLTQLNRSPVIKKGATTGEYLLDNDAPSRLREQMAALRRKLAALETSAGSAEEVAATRVERRRLTTSANRVERQLEEALRQLNPSDNSRAAP